MKNHFKIAICQLKVIDNKEANINQALKMINTSTQNNADMIILPEMFNCPYDNGKFIEYAEPKNSSVTLKNISKAAADNQILVIAGSIPLLDNGKIYNTCFIFNKKGEIAGEYRKMHLFDIDTPKIKFKESSTLSAGNKIGVFETEFLKMGIAICYDIRFPELLRIITLKGAKLVVVPGAFNMTTGPAHWEILMRSRAVDNQVFIAAASPARNEELPYVTYGNSMVVSPWGDILVRADEKEGIIYADIDISKIHKIRDELPLLKNRRDDIYEIIEKNP